MGEDLKESLKNVKFYVNGNVIYNSPAFKTIEELVIEIERKEIQTALYDLVEKIEYLKSNLENASDSQLEDIKQIRNIMDILYLKVLKEQFKRA